MRYFGTVISTAVDGIIVIDAKGRIRIFNAACERLFGYMQDDVAQQNVKMLMPQPYRAEHDAYLTRYRSDRRKTHHRYWPRGHGPAQGWQHLSHVSVGWRG